MDGFPINPRVLCDIAAPVMRMRGILDSGPHSMRTDFAVAREFVRWTNMTVDGLRNLSYELPPEVTDAVSAMKSSLAQAAKGTGGIRFFGNKIQPLDCSALGRFGENLVSSGFVQAADNLWQVTWASGCYPLPFEVEPVQDLKVKEKPDAILAKAEPQDNRSNAIKKIISLWTGGVSDERIGRIAAIVDSDLSVNEKLQQMNELMPNFHNASAQRIANCLGVTKPAVMKTKWWQENRRGENSARAAWRENNLRERGTRYEPNHRGED